MNSGGSMSTSSAKSKVKLKKGKKAPVKNPLELHKLVPKKDNYFVKANDEINHLVTVCNRDNLSPRLQQSINGKLLLAKKQLQLRTDPLEITRPLAELQDIIADHSRQASDVMNQQMKMIQTFTAEDAQQYQGQEPMTQRLMRDRRGLQMKRLLNESKAVVSRLSDMNELKIVLRQAIENILKASGYLLDSANTYQAAQMKRWGVRGNRTPTVCKTRATNWTKMSGVLDHLQRVCQRPHVPPELQEILMSKIQASRRLIGLKYTQTKIAKPLQEVVEVINQHCLESSESMNLYWDQVLSKPMPADEENHAFSESSKSSESEGIGTRKALSCAKNYLDYLSGLNELKMIIKTSADAILSRGSEKPGSGDSATDSTTSLLLPENIQVALKMTIDMAEKAMQTKGGQKNVQIHLDNLRKSVKSSDNEKIAKSCQEVIDAVKRHYKNPLHINTPKTPKTPKKPVRH